MLADPKASQVFHALSMVHLPEECLSTFRARSMAPLNGKAAAWLPQSKACLRTLLDIFPPSRKATSRESWKKREAEGRLPDVMPEK